MPYTPGPFDSEHLYVQWGGKLPGAEQWSCGLRMRKEGMGAVDSGAGLLVGVAAAIATFHADTGAHISSHAKLSFVKCNAIGLDGRYIGDGTNEAVYPDLAGAWTGLPKFPNQVAWGVSLLTGFSRGPAHRGRFYLPLPSADLGDDGRFSVAHSDELRETVTELITALNAVDPDYEVAVFSRKSGAAGNRRVTAAEVGRVPDTQRRRRRSLVEDYQ